ncbi:hypothetical protein HS088_TW06G00233 [Tripterygium wilfordii]|uniref:Uncharacterized protein n=1 Tax=Tripterygium wilfordii TaxID=458696 RepID=A0A7J7DIE2_TRIWF|nr:uncharacterized protein LOC120000083 [Tripterygium wilfordii]KAF5746068.1 hypothetical protein HS088_TW06G00233 [Tripterygium wilfordii]
MGNCLTSNKIQVEEETIEPQMLPMSRSEVKKNVEGDKIKKKIVRFKLQEQGSVDEGGRGESTDGAVRIRVVLTKQELKLILNCKQDFKDSSLEQFINAMKSRKRINILEARTSDGGFNGNWRPALESISEDL